MRGRLTAEDLAFIERAYPVPSVARLLRDYVALSDRVDALVSRAREMDGAAVGGLMMHQREVISAFTGEGEHE